MAIGRADGQATVEYTAVIALVGVVLAVGAAVVTVTGVGDRLLYTCLYGSQAGDKRRRLRPNPALAIDEQDPDTLFALDLVR